jgi:hypothetical protein
VPSTVISLVSVVSLVLAAAALTLATIANRRWARRARPTGGAAASADQDLARAGGSDIGPTAAGPAAATPTAAGPAVTAADLDALATALDSMGSAVDQVRRQVEEAAAAAQAAPRDPTALRHVALVRYDAFADVGGRLSYSVAVLDDTESGLVLTTLAGKSDVRTYVRTVSGGTADGTLTAEEIQAIEAAGRQA